MTDAMEFQKQMIEAFMMKCQLIVENRLDNPSESREQWAIDILADLFSEPGLSIAALGYRIVREHNERVLLLSTRLGDHQRPNPHPRHTRSGNGTSMGTTFPSPANQISHSKTSHWSTM